MALISILFAPAFAQTPQPPLPRVQPTQVPPSQRNFGSAVTYEDCVARCQQCGSGHNPECSRNFCTGYPHRKPGAAPLPVVCPDAE